MRLIIYWLESTHHELVHLRPRLVDSRILIIEYWADAEKAVSRFFSEQGTELMKLVRLCSSVPRVQVMSM
jgi:O-methyltransferase